VLGVVATAYAAALLVWGDSPKASLALLWSWTGAQAAGLCLLNYLLRGLRWRLWMAHYGRHFGWLQGCACTWRATPSRPRPAMSARRRAA
jgi:uncharacterized membrane protein YbhN (UPF0104 family)